MKAKAFSKEGAITCELFKSGSQSQYTTIIFEFANPLNSQPGSSNISYNWSGKKQFQLTQDELFYFIAFCTRDEVKLEFNGHDNNKKQMIAIRKEAGFMFLLNWGKIKMKCMVRHPNLFQIFNIGVHAMHLNSPKLSHQNILASVAAFHIK